MAKIMVVEDEEIIRQLIMEELEKWQFETFGTTDFNQVFSDFERTTACIARHQSSCFGWVLLVSKNT